MDEEREKNLIEDEKQQLIKLKIINSSDWNIGDEEEERKPSAMIRDAAIDDEDKSKIDQEISSSIPPPPPPLTRICEECGKVFSSGKALGGHKRFHIQEARKVDGVFIPRKTMKLKLKKHTLVGLNEVKINTQEEEEEKKQKQKEKEKSICCLCQKEFPSKKSLFGHMRSHRDRDWRGIQPPPEITIMSDHRSRSITSSCSPPTAAAAAAPEEEAEASLDQLMTESRVSTFEPVEVLGKWRKTDKRGRKSSVGGGDRVAAERLVSLSLGGEEEEEEEEGGQPSNLTKRMNSGYDSDDSYWLREDQELVQEEHHVDHIMQPNNILDSGAHQLQGIILLQQPNDHCDVVSNKRKMTTKKLDEKIVNRPRKKPNTTWFKCSSCGKSFPTFQALGGHRSSHNKDKHNMIMTNINQDQAPPLVMNSEASESSQTGPRKVLDFDLNETYVMEDHDDEEGA